MQYFVLGGTISVRHTFIANIKLKNTNNLYIWVTHIFWIHLCLVQYMVVTKFKIVRITHIHV
jgi:hypothetical protein